MKSKAILFLLGVVVVLVLLGPTISGNLILDWFSEKTDANEKSHVKDDQGFIEVEGKNYQNFEIGQNSLFDPFDIVDIKKGGENRQTEIILSPSDLSVDQDIQCQDAKELCQENCPFKPAPPCPQEYKGMNLEGEIYITMGKDAESNNRIIKKDTLTKTINGLECSISEGWCYDPKTGEFTQNQEVMVCPFEDQVWKIYDDLCKVSKLCSKNGKIISNIDEVCYWESRQCLYCSKTNAVKFVNEELN